MYNYYLRISELRLLNNIMESFYIRLLIKPMQEYVFQRINNNEIDMFVLNYLLLFLNILV